MKSNLELRLISIGLYIGLVSSFVVSCSNKSPNLKMVSLNIIDQRDFEVCFNENIDGLYCAISIFTKSKKEEIMVVPDSISGHSCFKKSKMQYSFRAYDDDETKFYEDSIVNNNIAKVKWRIYKSYHDQESIAEGILNYNTKL